MGTRLEHRLHALIYEAPDLKGEWVAHCLELDLITQGTSALDALEMLAEAIQIVALENARQGRFELEFRSAPREEWDKLEGARSLADRLIRLPAKGQLSDEVTITSSVASAG